jgi:hypothetical protein
LENNCVSTPTKKDQPIPEDSERGLENLVIEEPVEASSPTIASSLDCAFGPIPRTSSLPQNDGNNEKASKVQDRYEPAEKVVFSEDNYHKLHTAHDLESHGEETAIQNLDLDPTESVIDSALSSIDSDDESVDFYEVGDIAHEDGDMDWVRWAPCLVHKDQANSMPVVVRQYEERKKKKMVTSTCFGQNHRSKDLSMEEPIEDCITVGAWHNVDCAAASSEVMYEVEEIIGERTIGNEGYYEVRYAPSAVSKRQRRYYPQAVRRWESRKQNTAHKRKAGDDGQENGSKKSRST